MGAEIGFLVLRPSRAAGTLALTSICESAATAFLQVLDVGAAR